MSAELPVREGQVLRGPLFSEPMRVETIRPGGPGVWNLGLAGTRTSQFRRVTLTVADIAGQAMNLIADLQHALDDLGLVGSVRIEKE